MVTEAEGQAERLAEIEHIVACQDQQIQDLSDMVNKQWKEIDRLKQHLSHATQRLENLENPSEDDAISHEIPPHY
ncbi:MAG: SlyX family protein [Alphaproteobacteria bacterium]|nr:SlyX family protein [Alphaproteobacteria bacterium]